MQKRQDQKQKNAGFTLAELLLVIGILSILLTIGMLSVQVYRKNLKMMEMDRMAKQIFIAAQNHMTALKTSGKWETYQNKSDMLRGEIESGLGKKMEKPADYPTTQIWSNSEIGIEGEHHYYVVGHTEETHDLSQSILEELLPQNAIDDVVRHEGKYMIEYDYATATVYGVFYTDSSEEFRYETDIMGANGLNTLGGRKSDKDGKNVRKEYQNKDGKNVLIGYYGGSVSQVLSSKNLREPTIKIENEERLIVTITDSNDNVDETHVELEVVGKESGAIKQVRLLEGESDSWWSSSSSEDRTKREYRLIFDDITKQGGHFVDLFEGFIPGEDIFIKATCSSNKVFANLASSQATTNSLFAQKTQIIDTTDINASYAKATVSNARHLQNLSPDVSGLPVQVQAFPLHASKKDTMIQIEAKSLIKEVEQTKDIDWDTFWKQIESSKHIYLYNKENSSAGKSVEEQAFYPISNRAIGFYEGFGKTIKNLILTDQELTDMEQANSGIFAEIGTIYSSQTLKIQNLVLQNVAAIGSKNVGILLGEAKQNTKLEVKNVQIIDPSIEAGESAGGVVGKAEENANIQITEVHLVNPTIQAREDSGGLVGTMLSGTIVKSGVFFTDNEEKDGMTASEKYKEGAYSEETKGYGSKYFIVSSHGNAGGIVGSLEKKATIKQSFASVPIVAESGSAGGLLGENKGNHTKITNSYSGGYTENGLYTQSYSVVAMDINSGTAGGLLGKNTGSNVTIQNSYANGSVFGKQIGGFVGSDESDSTDYLNCYATGLVTAAIEENAIKGAFAGQIATQNKSKNCYYLIDSNKNVAGVGKGTDHFVGKNYEDLQKNVTFKEVYNSSGHEITPTLADDETQTHAYDTFYLGETYPFPVVTTTGYQGEEEQRVRSHYGDWQKYQKTTAYDFDLGFVYYELLEDKEGNEDPTFYYHGWGGLRADDENDPNNYTELYTKGDDLVDGLSREPDMYVRQEGYVLLIKGDMDMERLGIRIFANNNMNDIKYSNLVKDACIKRNIVLPEEFSGYTAYEIKTDLLNQWYFQQGIPQIVFGYLSEPNNVWGGKMEGKVGFSMNHAFADSAKFMGEIYDSTLYTIRSVRHLYNLENNNALSGWGGEKNKFIQTLDIDVNRKVNQQIYPMKRIENMTATYTSVYHKKSKQTYKIVGLSIQLFGTIQRTATMKGITLVDLNIRSNGDVSGFATENYGVIDSCSIRPSSVDGDDYESVILEGDQVYGFVKNNTENGRIVNSYVSGTLIGRNSATGFIGENQLSSRGIESCYVNAIITGGSSASGFLLNNNANRIMNCFVVGSVSSNTGEVAGFVFNSNQTSGVYKNCYTALWELSGKRVYMFGFTNEGEEVVDCYWLNSGKVSGEVVTPNNATRYDRSKAREYNQMKAQSKSLVTYKYESGIVGTDMTNDSYPFLVVSTQDAYKKLEFWGDWPGEPLETQVGFVYYEIVEGKVYYNGYLVDVMENGVLGRKEIMTKGYESTDGLLSDPQKQVTKSGYLILAEEQKILPKMIQSTSDSTDILSLKKIKIKVPVDTEVRLASYELEEHLETDSSISRTLNIVFHSSKKKENDKKISFSFTPSKPNSMEYKQ